MPYVPEAMTLTSDSLDGSQRIRRVRHPLPLLASGFTLLELEDAASYGQEDRSVSEGVLIVISVKRARR